MAKALHQKAKPVFANGEQPPAGIDPARWDPIADPNTNGAFLSGSDAGQLDYGDFVMHLRQGVMAGRFTPEGISRPEASWRLNQELGRSPYLHEVTTGRDEEIWAERLQTFAELDKPRGLVRRDVSTLAEVRAAYDLTDEQYQQWLANRHSQAHPNSAAEPTPDDGDA